MLFTRSFGFLSTTTTTAAEAEATSRENDRRPRAVHFPWLSIAAHYHQTSSRRVIIPRVSKWPLALTSQPAAASNKHTRTLATRTCCLHHVVTRHVSTAISLLMQTPHGSLPSHQILIPFIQSADGMNETFSRQVQTLSEATRLSSGSWTNDRTWP